MKTITINLNGVQETEFSIAELQKWSISDIQRYGDTVFFMRENMCYSMASDDYDLIFKK